MNHFVILFQTFEIVLFLQQASFDQWNLRPGPIGDTISIEMPPSLVSCRHQNCLVTFDKRHLQDSDAVLLSLYDLKIYLTLVCLNSKFDQLVFVSCYRI